MILLPLLAALALAPPSTLRLPTNAAPVRYDVTLDVDPASESFHGILDLDLTFATPSRALWLNGTALLVSHAELSHDGHSTRARALATTSGFLGFEFDDEIPAGPAHLHVDYAGEISETDVVGLFRQTETRRSYAFTQFEEFGARRVFPCFDEPSFKTPWRITLVVPQALVAVSNMPVESQRRAKGRRTIRFAETPPLPSYLVAFAVGPFDVVDAGRAGRNHTPMRIFVPKGRRRDAALAARTLPPIIPALEEYFGIPFPWPKLDIVSIPHFNGAMENVGMITDTERALLVPPREENPGETRRALSLLSHEISHQWFGDLVTMSWWDDLWLNEAFASWMETRIPSRLHPEWKLEPAFVAERSGAMQGDERISARRIRQSIVTNDDIVGALDAITYTKAESVLTMFEAALGEEVFRAGVRDYLRAHAFGSATTADFVASLSRAAGRDLGPDFSSFLDAPGVPLVSAALVCSDGRASLSLTQSRLLPLGSEGDAAQTWHVPVCARSASVSRACTALDAPEGRLDLPGASCSEWFLVDPGATGYYRVRYEGDLLARLARAEASLSLSERLGVLEDTTALFFAGRAPAADAFAAATRAAASGEPRLVDEAAGFGAEIDDAWLVPENVRPDYERWIRGTFGDRARALGFRPRKGETDETRLLRPAIVGLVAGLGNDRALAAEAVRLARLFLRDRRAVDPAMIETVLAVAARHGGAELFDAISAAARKAKVGRDRSRMQRALLAFTDPPLFRRALELIDAKGVPPVESLSLLGSSFSNRATRDDAWEWEKRHFDALAPRLPSESVGELAAAGEAFCDEEHRTDVALFFRDRLAALPNGQHGYRQAMESLDLCIARRAALRGDVAAFLKTAGSNPALPR